MNTTLLKFYTPLIFLVLGLMGANVALDTTVTLDFFGKTIALDNPIKFVILELTNVLAALAFLLLIPAGIVIGIKIFKKENRQFPRIVALLGVVLNGMIVGTFVFLLLSDYMVS